MENTKKNNGDKHFEAQKKLVFRYLLSNTATATMVAEATGIPQKNICRYKYSLEKENKLWPVERKPCKITGRKASYLSTNPQALCK